MQDHFAASVQYSSDDYLRLRQTYRKWWADELERPIIPIVTTGHDSCRQPSPYPALQFDTAWDLSITPAQLIDGLDWQLSQTRWHGDAFPQINMDRTGPGSLAAFLGCRPVGTQHTVWFEPEQANVPLRDLHFEMDMNNPHLRRIIALYETAMEKWRGSVVIGMPDLGGCMDVLASIRGTENLLMDLYDDPEEVIRCEKEIHELWFRYFDLFSSITGSDTMGYTHWYGIYDEQPSYILQCDFSYMIGPDMYDAFVHDHLAKSAARLTRPFYHMDGVGQIAHLDRLLSIPEIVGIQWQPGAGEPGEKDWSEILERILASGKKLIDRNTKPDGRPIDLVKNPGQLFCPTRRFDVSELNAAREYAGLYGIEIQ